MVWAAGGEAEEAEQGGRVSENRPFPRSKCAKVRKNKKREGEEGREGQSAKEVERRRVVFFCSFLSLSLRHFSLFFEFNFDENTSSPRCVCSLALLVLSLEGERRPSRSRRAASWGPRGSASCGGGGKATISLLVDEASAAAVRGGAPFFSAPPPALAAQPLAFVLVARASVMWRARCSRLTHLQGGKAKG